MLAETRHTQRAAYRQGYATELATHLHRLAIDRRDQEPEVFRSCALGLLKARDLLTRRSLFERVPTAL